MNRHRQGKGCRLWPRPEMALQCLRSEGRIKTEMIALERDNIRLMRASQGRYPALVSGITRNQVEKEYSHLSRGQHRAVQEILGSRDQITALEGVAGAGKTTSLSAHPGRG